MLARLQACGVLLDREWTALRESTPCPADSGPGGTAWSPPPPDAPVPAHRDLHAAQVVVAPGAVRLIDLDEAAMAPAGLDVGNFLAHLDRDAALGSARRGDKAQPAGRSCGVTAAIRAT